MPGVLRPYTLVDVLGVLNQQNTQQQSAQLVNGLGDFAEADEAFTTADSVTASHAVNATWDNGTWGAVTWG